MLVSPIDWYIDVAVVRLGIGEAWDTAVEQRIAVL